MSRCSVYIHFGMRCVGTAVCIQYRVCVRACVRMCAYVCACVCARVRACVRACVCARACVRACVLLIQYVIHGQTCIQLSINIKMISSCCKDVCIHVFHQRCLSELIYF